MTGLVQVGPHFLVGFDAINASFAKLSHCRWGQALHLFCGVLCLLAGLALSTVFPINKALWSPSFTLVVGGISYALLSLFYWVVDVNGWRRWTFFFTVIGMNSITIYMAQKVIG